MVTPAVQYGACERLTNSVKLSASMTGMLKGILLMFTPNSFKIAISLLPIRSKGLTSKLLKQ